MTGAETDVGKQSSERPALSEEPVGSELFDADGSVSCLLLQSREIPQVGDVLGQHVGLLCHRAFSGVPGESTGNRIIAQPPLDG